MGEDALEFLNELEFPLSRPLDGYAGRAPALHADDRGARRPRHRPLARRAGREDALLERLQARRPLVGRAAALLALVGRARRVVRGRAAPRRVLALWRDVALVALVLMPARLRARLARAAVSATPVGRRSRRRSCSRRARASSLGAARACPSRELREVRARMTFLGWLFLALFEGSRGSSLVALHHPVGRRLLGLARADEDDHRAPCGTCSSALSVAFVVPGGGAARLGLPDVLFFARLPRRERRASACGRPGPGSRMIAGLGADARARDVWWDVGGLPALPAISLGFLLAERRPALAAAARSAPASAARRLLALEQRDRLDVRRVREHVDRPSCARAGSRTPRRAASTSPASVVGLHET